MASQGPLYPATAASLSNAGSSENAEAWVSPGNISSDNGTASSITAATYDSPDISQLLVASNFGFTIPSDATIDGIVVEVDRNNAAGAASDNRVQLATGTTFASLVGSNKAATATDWPAALAIVSYGTSTDLWAAGLTVAQINAAGFAVMLSVQADAANTDVSVDFIRVTVTYTPNPITIVLALINQTAVAFAPTVSTLNTYTPALINQTAVAFAPTVYGRYGSAVLADSPLSWWRLGEASGNPQDAVGNNHVTQVNGSPTYGVSGAISLDSDTAITFGSGNSFEVNDDASLDLANGAFSIEAWCRRPVGGDTDFILSKGSGSFAFGWGSNNRLQLLRSNEVTLSESTQAITPDPAWLHVVVTYAGSNGAIKFYLNSSPFGSFSAASNFVDNTSHLFLGDDRGVATFNGSLDEIALYDHVLSGARITAHYLAAGPLQVASVGLISNAAATFTPTVLRGAVDVGPGFINQPASSFSPTISVGAAPVSVGIIDRTASTFTPTVTPGSVSVSVSLIDQTATTSAPTIAPGSVSVSPNFVNQTATTSAPTITTGAVSVTPNLINQTATASAPTATNLATISVALINQTAATFAPVVIEQQFYTPALLNQAAATFNPTTTSVASISLALIDQAASAFTPMVTPGAVAVSLGQINQAASAQAPTVTTQTSVSVGLINQTASAFSPSVTNPGVAQDYSPVLLSAAASTFSPTVTTQATVELGLINQAAQTFAPSTFVSQAVVLGLISQLATPFDPTLTPGLVAIFLDRIEQAATASEPTISTTVSVSLGRITQTASASDPTVSTQSAISLPLLTDTATVFAPTVFTAGAQSVELGFIDQTAQGFEPRLQGPGTQRHGAGRWQGYVYQDINQPQEESELQLVGFRTIAVNPRLFALSVTASDDEVALGLDDESLLVLV